MIRFIPLLAAFASALLMVVSRLVTNRYCRKHARAIVAAGSFNGFIPTWVSALYSIGMAGLFVSLIWSFFSIAWWASILVLLLYLATGLVHSEVFDLNSLLRFNKQKNG